MFKLAAIIVLGLLALFLLSGCSTAVKEYKDEQPLLELDKFFDGHLVAYGIVQNFSGKVIRRFEADILATWEGNSGVLDESFQFSDGEFQTRCWRLVKEDNRYTGRAGDIVGEAAGEVYGNTLNWKYILEVPVNGKVWNIALDDWLYLVDENNLINRTKMSKFGLPVGQLTLHIRKITPAEAATREMKPNSCRGELS